MCSCNISRVHIYTPSDSLLENLFRLDLDPPPGVKFWLCECPSSYLFNGILTGAPLAVAVLVAAISWHRSRVVSLAIAGIALVIWLAYYGQSAAWRLETMDAFLPDERSRIIYAVALQALFDLILYVGGPVFLTLAARRIAKAVGKSQQRVH